MFKKSFHRTANERGIVLVVALIVLLMLTLIGLAAVLTSTTEVNIAGNEKAGTQALYLDEAGVSAVKSLFENPSSFTPPAGSIECLGAGGVLSEASCSMVYQTSATSFNKWPSSFFEKRRLDALGAPSYINAAGVSQYLDLNNDSVLDTNNYYDDGDPVLDFNKFVPGDVPAMRIKSKDYINNTLLAGAFKDVGQIEVIEIYPPLTDKTYAVIRVVATSGGSTRVVEQEIGSSPFGTITAGAQGGGNLSWKGKGTIHWGSVRVEGDVEKFAKDDNVPSNKYCFDTGCSYKDKYDKWFRVDAGGEVPDKIKDFALCTVPECAPSKFKYFNVQENMPVSLETLKYTEMKATAKDSGSYYVVCGDLDKKHQMKDEDHVIYKGSCGNGAALSFEELTKFKTFDMLFLESDGATDTTPGFTLNQNEKAYWSVGNLYINGNVKWNGKSADSKPTVIEDPDGVADDSALKCMGLADQTTCTTNITFNGLVYTTGSFKGKGRPSIYGALVSEGGLMEDCDPADPDPSKQCDPDLQLSGHFDLYYNAKFSQNLGGLPRTSKQIWREIHR